MSRNSPHNENVVSHHQHGSAIDLPSFKVREYLVDIVELGLVDLSFHFAFCCKCNGFYEILAAAHDGAPNRYAVEHHIEDWRLKFSRRKTDEANGALASDHLERLGESGRRHCGHKDAVGAAAGLLDDLRSRIG